jgi:hypothetical protein
MSRLPNKKYERLVARRDAHLSKTFHLEQEILALLRSLNKGQASEKAWHQAVFMSTYDEDGGDDSTMLEPTLGEQMEAIHEDMRGDA